ncbi:MAG: DEAD/DEAH box helicase [Candidatus Njordarchaeia archaeon]
MKIARDGLEIAFIGFNNRDLFEDTPAVYDTSTKTWRCLPIHYFDVKRNLEQKGLSVPSSINEDFKLSDDILGKFGKKFTLRDYQLRAVELLKVNDYKGVVVLPTGSGKTTVALEVMHRVKLKTLIVVPTLDLLDQWVRNISKNLSIPVSKISVYGGNRFEIGEITVVTYASAKKVDFLKKVVDYFGLIVFDEAHHLTSELNQEIAKRLIAEYRVGLTATPGVIQKRRILEELVGPIIEVEKVKSLVEKGYLAPFEFSRIYIELAPDEKERYRRLMNKYLNYVKKFSYMGQIERFNQLVKLSVRDKKAREVLLARLEAKDIAMKSKEKMRILVQLLEKHIEEKTIIFTRHTDEAKYISAQLGIPYITGDIDKKRRKETLEMFKRNKVSKLVTAEVLDEGVDMPSASVGIILAGRPSKTQFIQRIGRLLRPGEGKVAQIYEVVTRGTYDYFASRKRSVKLDRI